MKLTKDKTKLFAIKYGTIIALIVMFIVFAFASERFLLPDNLLNIIKQTSILIIVALGVTVVMGAGEFDLCTGNVVSLATILCAFLMAKKGWGMWPTLLLTVGLGAAVGMVNGFFVVKVGIPSMITTLAMSSFLTGFANSLTQGKSIYGAGINQSLIRFASGSVGFMSNLSLIGIGFVVVIYLFLNRSVAGRYIYSISGNKQAAKLSGVNVNFWRIFSLTLCSTFAAIAGILLMARLGAGSSTSGTGYTMSALSAVFIGMTCVRVGRPNVIGTLVGALLIAILENGLNMLGVTYYFQDMISGGVMIAAIALTATQTELKF